MGCQVRKPRPSGKCCWLFIGQLLDPSESSTTELPHRTRGDPGERLREFTPNYWAGLWYLLMLRRSEEVGEKGAWS